MNTFLLTGARPVLYPRMNAKTDVLAGSATRTAYSKSSSCPRQGENDATGKMGEGVVIMHIDIDNT